MLELTVHHFDQDVVLRFEHSLLSLSKWESKYKKAFMTKVQKSNSELLDYFQMMLLSPEDDPDLVLLLSTEQMDELVEYMNTPQTASSVPEDGQRKIDDETVTSELMYFWLTALRIPFQPTETWHLSRLTMLVQITGYKQQPEKKKRFTRRTAQSWVQENERRKKMLGTSG